MKNSYTVRGVENFRKVCRLESIRCELKNFVIISLGKLSWARHIDYILGEDTSYGDMRNLSHEYDLLVRDFIYWNMNLMDEINHIANDVWNKYAV